MGSNYIFSLTPTFTQGLLLGQLSILALLALILKYLFLDSGPQELESPLSYSIASFTQERENKPRQSFPAESGLEQGEESTAWFNLIIRQVVETYRSKLRNDLPGSEGDEIARRRIERYANAIRPASFVDPIRILTMDLGSSAPKISNPRIKDRNVRLRELDQAVFDMTYIDSLSVSLSTSVLFHYPMPLFVRLPITLNVSLSLFSASVTLTPPDPLSTNPTLTVSLPADFTLELKTTSLMGSRAKLADVPKLHEMIQAQVRRVLAERGTWKVVMPWLTTVEDVQEEMAREESVIFDDD
ncbi:MMM1 [Sanghuangporus weigelae]